MTEIKIVLSNPKTGKSYQKVLKDEASEKLMGKKIGDTIKGELLDLAGYEFEITGGSDFAGFPMRADAQGFGRKKILATHGVGLKKKRKWKGRRIRKTVAGNTIFEKTAQVNMKVLKEGKMPLGEEKPAEAPKEEVKKETEEKPKPEEKPKEESAEAPKKEEKKEAKPEAPKEEKPAEKPKKKEPEKEG